MIGLEEKIDGEERGESHKHSLKMSESKEKRKRGEKPEEPGEMS